MVRCKLFDGVVSEDVVRRLISPDEVEKLGGGGGFIEDVSVRKAFCLISVDGDRATGVGVSGVAARAIVVLLGVRLLVFFTDVVSDPVDIPLSMLDRFNIGVITFVVEAPHLTLEAGAEDDDDVDVVTSIGVNFSGEFDPLGGVGVIKEVGEITLGEVGALGIGQKESLRVQTRGHFQTFGTEQIGL